MDVPSTGMQGSPGGVAFGYVVWCMKTKDVSAAGPDPAATDFDPF